MPKDKQETRKRILEAVGNVLTHSGMANIGINSIAHQAGVDKVLIYRYFGSLDDLLRAYIEQTELWPSTSDLLGEKVNIRQQSDLKAMLRDLLVNQLTQIRRRKVTQEILRWETIEENILTSSLSTSREKQLADFLKSISLNNQSTKDLEALLALIASGITHLVLLSKVSDKYLGIDLRSNFGWQRLAKLIDELVAAYLNTADSP